MGLRINVLKECMMHRALLIAVGLMLATPVYADAPNAFETGNDVLRFCTIPEHQACMGYVTAVVDVISNNRINGFDACLPANVTRRQAVDVAKTWLTNNAKYRHLNGAGLIATAFQEAWPC